MSRAEGTISSILFIDLYSKEVNKQTSFCWEIGRFDNLRSGSVGARGGQMRSSAPQQLPSPSGFQQSASAILSSSGVYTHLHYSLCATECFSWWVSQDQKTWWAWTTFISLTGWVSLFQKLLLFWWVAWMGNPQTKQLRRFYSPRGHCSS